jgi:hypothetical protein
MKSVWDTATLAVDIKSKFTLWVLSAEIDLTSRGVDSLGCNDKVMDELFHLLENIFLWRKCTLSINDVDWSLRDVVDSLPENTKALAHLLNPNKIAIKAIAHGANGNIEIVLFVVKIRVRLADIVINSRAA